MTWYGVLGVGGGWLGARAWSWTEEGEVARMRERLVVCGRSLCTLLALCPVRRGGGGLAASLDVVVGVCVWDGVRLVLDQGGGKPTNQPGSSSSRRPSSTSSFFIPAYPTHTAAYTHPKHPPHPLSSLLLPLLLLHREAAAARPSTRLSQSQGGTCFFCLFCAFPPASPVRPSLPQAQAMSSSMINRFVGAIDQGTSSTKFVVYNHNGHPVGLYQMEHTQIYPQPGWVEHDPMEIWDNTVTCIREAMGTAGVDKEQLEAVGITNQRESTLVWNKTTGLPYYNVIVWNDARTRGICEDLKKASRKGMDRFRDKTGLPIATYFSATKILWLLENVPGLREDAEKGEAIFGTLDSWLIYKLTNGQVRACVGR